MRAARVRRTVAVFGALALACASLSLAAVNSDPRTPDGLVRAVTRDMLKALRNHREAIVNDPRRLASLMQQLIVPHFDTRSMARVALGKYWRQASDDQRDRFASAFRQLLVDDYVAVFSTYSNQTVEVLPVRSRPRAGLTLAETPGRFCPPVSYMDYPVRITVPNPISGR